MKWQEYTNKAKELQNKNITKNKNQNEDLEKKRQKIMQIHRMRNNRLKIENERLCSETKILKKKLQAMQKKLYRHKKKFAELNEKYNNAIKHIEEINSAATSTNPNNYETPRKKAQTFVDKSLPEVSTPCKEIVKKKILELNVLKEALKDEYVTSKSNEQKRILKNIVNNDIVKKYNLKGKMTATIGLKTNMRKYRDKKLKKTVLMHKVRAFYERDDVSRASAGKK